MNERELDRLLTQLRQPPSPTPASFADSVMARIASRRTPEIGTIVSAAVAACLFVAILSASISLEVTRRQADQSPPPVDLFTSAVYPMDGLAR
ncbi:MAG: hypothetical protein WD342_13115 [Verrucomicrobiales bacterium]